jgi:hypothetical protein
MTPVGGVKPTGRVVGGVAQLPATGVVVLLAVDSLEAVVALEPALSDGGAEVDDDSPQ